MSADVEKYNAPVPTKDEVKAILPALPEDRRWSIKTVGVLEYADDDSDEPSMMYHVVLKVEKMEKRPISVGFFRDLLETAGWQPMSMEEIWIKDTEYDSRSNIKVTAEDIEKEAKDILALHVYHQKVSALNGSY